MTLFPYFDENFLSIKNGEIQIISIKIKVRVNFVLIISGNVIKIAIDNTWLNIINLNAQIKIISQDKKNDEILIMFNELINEMKKIELRERVESLENEVSLNLDEKLYSELLSLRNQLKSG